MTQNSIPMEKPSENLSHPAWSEDIEIAFFDPAGHLVTATPRYRRTIFERFGANAGTVRLADIVPREFGFGKRPDQERSVNWVLTEPSGHRFSMRVKQTMDGYVLFCREFLDHDRERNVALGREKVLRVAAEGKSLDEILKKLVLTSQEANPGMCCSILQVDPIRKVLEKCIAPSLPMWFREASNDFPVKHGHASCGNTAATGRDTFVGDMTEHPNWADLRHIAEKTGFRSCWSTPVLDRKGRVFATFAMYGKHPRDPDHREIEFMHSTALLAGLVIGHHRSEDQLKFLAYHDPLTNLLNRRGFFNEAIKLVNRAEDPIFHLLYLDLDRFKEVNDTLGQMTADSLLVHASAVLRAIVGDQGCVGWMESGDFAIFLKGGINTYDVLNLTDQIRSRLASGAMLEYADYNIDCHIGISVFRGEAPDIEQMMHESIIAMREAQTFGIENVRFYTEAMGARIERENFVRAELEKAILNEKGLYLVFQPQVDMIRGRVIGCETLCRWNHPVLGEVAPNVFIDIAEKNGMIVSLSRLINRMAVARMQAWRSAICAPFRMAINFSGSHLLVPGAAAEFLTLIDDAGLQPTRFECEITERALIDDLKSAIDTLDYLKTRGVTISLDDFGTGYSSLSYIQRLPIDKLKIDQSFVMDIDSNPGSAKIVSVIIGLADGLGLDVLAEGTENKKQIDFLISQGCAKAQGYYYSKPLPADRFVEWYLLKEEEIARRSK